jgi:Fic family protein
MGKIIKPEYFKTWKSMLDVDIRESFSEIQHLTIEPHSFTFYTSVSVMSSSKIEGEPLELDSYVKHKILNIEYLPELTEKPNDLYNAYLFANKNKLTRKNFQEAHKLVAAHLLPKIGQGTLRHTEMIVLEHNTGKIQYEAAQLSILKERYDKFWKELELLLNKELTIDEVFYNAAFIHLSFVNIHPFSDGNGRISRLLEKWFLAEKLGERAWFIQSEKYYYKNVNEYYKNLARLGMFYDELDYEKSVPFLLMLPQSLNFEK